MQTTKSSMRHTTRVARACSVLAVLATAACGGDDSGDTSGSGGGTASGGTRTTAGSTGTGGSIGSGGSIGLGGTSGTGDAATDNAGNCGASKIEATAKEIDRLLVLDKSGSMASESGFGTAKWSAMKTALSTALTKVQGGLSFGLELFPHRLTSPIPFDCGTACWELPPGDSAILVPVAIGTTSVPSILTTLSGVEPSGGTPTAAALKAAADYFTVGAGKALAGDKYVLLATDGGPNGNATIMSCAQSECTTNLDNNSLNGDAGTFPNLCDSGFAGPMNCLDRAATVAQLSVMASAGLKTFVVGIASRSPDPYQSTLDEMAVAGGVPASTASPKYYAVTAAGGVSGLETVFETITKQLIKTCRLQLQSQPPDKTLINVYVDGKVVAPGTNGWSLDETTQPFTIVLQGTTCMTVESTGVSSVEVQYGC